MPAQCATPIKARVMRLIKLNECGVEVTGVDSAMVVTQGFVSVEAAPEYEEGTEFVLKNANGGLCVNDMDPDELKRVALTGSYCVLDPDATVIMTGERLLTAGGLGVTGTGVAFGTGPLTARFSMELWQPMAGAGACSPDGVQRYVYWAFMNSGNANVGSFTFENGTFEFEMAAETKDAWPQWSAGAPWLDGNTLEEGDHFLYNITTTPPPEPSCGAVEYVPAS